MDTFSSGVIDSSGLVDDIPVDSFDYDALMYKLDFISLILGKIETLLTFSLSLVVALLVCYILYCAIRKFI